MELLSVVAVANRYPKKMKLVDLLLLLAAVLMTASAAPTLRIGGSIGFHRNSETSSRKLLDFAFITNTLTVYNTTTETAYMSCYLGAAEPTCPTQVAQTFKRRRRALRIHVGDESLRQAQGTRMPELFPSPLGREGDEPLEKSLTGSLEAIIEKPKIKLWTDTTVTKLLTSTITDTSITQTVTTYYCSVGSSTPYPPRCNNPIRFTILSRSDEGVSNEQAGEDISVLEEGIESLSDKDIQVEKLKSGENDKLSNSQDSDANHKFEEIPKGQPEQSDLNEEVLGEKDNEHIISDISEDETLEINEGNGEQQNSNDALSLQTSNEAPATLAPLDKLSESTDGEREENTEILEPSVINRQPEELIHRDAALTESSKLSQLVPSETALRDSTLSHDQELEESATFESSLPLLISPVTQSPSLESPTLESIESLKQDSFDDQLSVSTGLDTEFSNPLTAESKEPLSLDSSKQSLQASEDPESESSESSTAESPDALQSETSEPKLPTNIRPESEPAESSTLHSAELFNQDLSEQPSFVPVVPESESFESSTSEFKELPDQISFAPEILLPAEVIRESSDLSTLENTESLIHDPLEPEFLRPAEEAAQSSELESVKSQGPGSFEEQLVLSTESKESLDQDSFETPPKIPTEIVSESSSALESAQSLKQNSSEHLVVIASETESKISESPLLEPIVSLNHDSFEHPLLIVAEPEIKTPGSSASESTESPSPEFFERPLQVATEPESTTTETLSLQSSESLDPNSSEHPLQAASEPEIKKSESPLQEPAESLHHDSSEHPLSIATEPEGTTAESSESEDLERTQLDSSDPIPSDSSALESTEVPQPGKPQLTENVILHTSSSVLHSEEPQHLLSTEATGASSKISTVHQI
ncbi:uro-adherence factor A-like [Macrobrachium rosenbergii]|uniref:uro-adherence factor A-like n=1 Tax=Macrobrachium rosenbergii TaxID=79674 RepID=UPI0034D60DCD